MVCLCYLKVGQKWRNQEMSREACRQVLCILVCDAQSLASTIPPSLIENVASASGRFGES